MSTARITTRLTDDAVLGELGQRLARHRLDRGLTQAALAQEAGVSKRTVERIEAGGSAQLASLVRILRALDLLGALDQAFPAAQPRPLELLAHKGRQRQRASSRTAPPAAGGEPWTWDDDP